MRSHEAKAQFREARKLYVERRFEEALAVLDELRVIFDAYPDLHYLRARCLGKLKRGEELRAVADLLTNRFGDPRGAEILTWFVRRPVPHGTADVSTPSAEIISEFPTPTGPEDAPAAAEPVADVEESARLVEQPEPTALEARIESDEVGSAVEETIPEPVHTTEPQTASPEDKRRPWMRRAAVVALAMLLVAGLGTALTSSAPLTEGSPETSAREGSSSTAMAALVTPSRVESPRDAAPIAPTLDVPRFNATVTFQPDLGGGYRVASSATASAIEADTPLETAAQVRTAPVAAWKVELPFAFPFGGVEWESAFVNLNGNITFGYAEADAWPERETSGSTTPRAVAAAIDSRAAAGRERMIAPLWRERASDDVRVYVGRSEDTVSISWVDFDEQTASITLHENGQIVLTYHNVDTNRAFAGVFPGIAWAGDPLAHAEDPEDADDPNVDITLFQIDDAPSVVQFTLTLAAAVPTTVSSGELIHRITLDTPDGPRQFGVTVTNEPRGWIDWGESPQTLGYERDENRLYLYLSKSLLRDFGECTAHAEVVWRGYDDLYDRVDEPPVAELTSADACSGEIEFANHSERGLGSIYSLFDGADGS